MNDGIKICSQCGNELETVEKIYKVALGSFGIKCVKCHQFHDDSFQQEDFSYYHTGCLKTFGP